MAGKYKYGRLPGMRPTALGSFEDYTVGKLPAPPAAVAVPAAAYPMDGNDTYGDCVMAGITHTIIAANVQADEKDPVPADQEVVDWYFKLTDGVDSGLVISQTLHHWHDFGLFNAGVKINGYVPVSTTNLLCQHEAVAFYGNCVLGIECPESAQTQFGAGQPWTYVANSPIEGGHCIVALGYTDTGSLLCATWGGIAEVTAGFLAHYLDEAWCVLPHQVVEAKKDQLGIDLVSLQADIAKV